MLRNRIISMHTAQAPRLCFLNPASAGCGLVRRSAPNLAQHLGSHIKFMSICTGTHGPDGLCVLVLAPDDYSHIQYILLSFRFSDMMNKAGTRRRDGFRVPFSKNDRTAGNLFLFHNSKSQRFRVIPLRECHRVPFEGFRLSRTL